MPKKNSDQKKRKSSKKIRYAVAGLGHISQIAVLPAFKHASKNSELVALISSDPEKLEKLGEKYEVPNLVPAEDYKECLESGIVDAVYIALPNSFHRAYTVAAARAGVHVLCEKPMALTVDECGEMIEECETAGVQLMIAYRLHFEKANLKAIETAQSGRLGDLKMFSSVFSFPIKDESNIRLSQRLGGGPLYDLGLYCINAARYLFQSEPLEVTALCTPSGEGLFDEVEESTSVLMRFPGDRMAQFTCSFGAVDTSSFEILGSKGCLRVEPAYDYAEPLEHQLSIGESFKEKKFPKTDQFGPEILYFSDCILNEKKPEPSGLEGLIDVNIINAIYRSIDERRAIRIEDFRKKERPTLRLLKKMPAIEEPQLVNVTSPSEPNGKNGKDIAKKKAQ
jgi:predicted dehydrogenase